MNPATILADARVLQLEYFRPSSDSVVLVVKTVQQRGHCPRCGRSSAKVYSRYTRCVADLPWHGVPVRLELHTRRFRCTLDPISAHLGKHALKLYSGIFLTRWIGDSLSLSWLARPPQFQNVVKIVNYYWTG